MTPENKRHPCSLVALSRNATLGLRYEFWYRVIFQSFKQTLLEWLFLAAVLLEFPVAVVERADLAGLEPAGDAVEVEGVLFVYLSAHVYRCGFKARILTLQLPHATVHSSLVAEAWLA